MNPLLSRDFRIPFDRIETGHVLPAIRAALTAADQELAALIAFSGPRSYANTMERLDELIERLDRVVGPVSHLVGVMNTPELREAYSTVLPEFSAFYAKLPLNEGLWQAIREYADTEDAAALTGVRRRHLEKTVREFVRAGADLPGETKARVEAIRVELSRLHTEFSNHTLDATNAFALVITDEADLAGLPETARGQARAAAEAKGVEGWRFTLQLPSYVAFMQYADRRELREQLYTVYMNRASEGDLDNRPLISQILEFRRELAQLLGFANYADYALDDAMVRSGTRALEFEEDLTRRTRPFWEHEVEELTAFAREQGVDPLQPWDVSYLTEKMRREHFDFDEEELRPYFALERVLSGMFEVARRIFGVLVTRQPLAEIWHPEVEYYEIRDEESGTHLGSFYADWFPRESKRGGAWMDSFITGGPRNVGEWAPHLGLMVGNFTPPEGERPALLTHREVETTFHEFGHLLHHCLSRVAVPSRAGTNVPRDWVELPSQIMENWTWERDALDLFARHYRTDEPIPEALFRKMRAARTFMAASAQMRQLSFGVTDLKLHIEYDPAQHGDVIAYVQKIMADFAIRPEFARNHFIASFTHVFAGGYAAGYYSYLWSEVLDADAFTRFQEEGIFNRATGRAYVDAILSRGDSADPADLFREFMGREPDLGALLARNLGLPKPEPAAAE